MPARDYLGKCLTCKEKNCFAQGQFILPEKENGHNGQGRIGPDGHKSLRVRGQIGRSRAAFFPETATAGIPQKNGRGDVCAVSVAAPLLSPTRPQ
jgi:hypothetical protein